MSQVTNSREAECSRAHFWFKGQAEQAGLASVYPLIQAELALQQQDSSTTGYMPPTAFKRVSHLKLVHLQNPGSESVARGTGRAPSAHIPASSAIGGEMETSGHGSWKRCCKWAVRKEGAALRKEEEGMKEERSHQQVPGCVTQSGAETG